MGFRPEPTIYKLVFDEDTGLAGLNVRAACCSIGEYNQMLRGSRAIEMADVPDDMEDPVAMAKAYSKMQEYSRQAADANDEAVALFLKYAVDWDLEGPDGQIVPLTTEGIATVEKPVITSVISAWHTAMMAVPVPLKQASTNGRRSEEASLEMESLSQSPQSWPQPS